VSDLNAWQDKLGIRFDSASLLERALVHSSYVNENPTAAPVPNERLEFLGDSVLGMVAAEELFTRYPECDEGTLTQMRSALVRTGTLSRVATNIQLGEYLYMGKGEEASGGRRNASNLAGAMEALIAAIYLDKGLAAARLFILDLFQDEFDRLKDDDSLIDYKSRLQHLYQSQYKQAPHYRTSDTGGDDPERAFIAEVSIEGRVTGSGYGRSKQAAEKRAARAALEKSGGDFTG
jgi:ribonuclease-3